MQHKPRKAAAVLLAVMLLLGSCLPVFADKSVANAAALMELWTQEALENVDKNDPAQLSIAYSFPFPDYINGVWSSDGSAENLTFAYLPGHREEAEAELLCVEDQSTVTLVEGGPYTVAELLAVQEEVVTLMGADSGVFGCGIDLKSNCVNCDINMSAPKAQDTVEGLTARFGDMLSFMEGEGVSVAEASNTAAAEPLPAGGAADAGREKASSSIVLPLVSLVVIGAALIALFVILTKRKQPPQS